MMLDKILDLMMFILIVGWFTYNAVIVLWYNNGPVATQSDVLLGVSIVVVMLYWRKK